MKKHFLLIVMAFVYVFSAHAQEEFTLYYLDNALPSTYVNPTASSQYKVTVGVPGLSSYGVGFNLGGLAVKSLVSLKGSTATVDLNRFEKRLNKVNFVSAGASVDLLAARVTVLDNSYSVTLRTVADVRATFPKGIVSILTEGVLNEPSFKKIGVQANLYHELGLGFNHHNPHEKLNYGGKVKILLGVANVNSNVNLSLDVNEDDLYQWQIDMDAKVDAASLFFQEDLDDESPSRLFFGGGNIGLGLDGGATYQWDDKLSFAASVVDLGFIRWKTNPLNARTEGSFSWDGIQITGDDFAHIDSLSNAFNGLQDEIEAEIDDVLDYDPTANSYSTGLYTRLNLTAHYQILPKTRLSGTLFTEFNKGIRTGFVIAGTQDFTSNFKFVLDFWRWRNTGTNMGLGFVTNFGPFQYHIMFDNVLIGRILKIDDGAGSGTPTGTYVPVPYNFRNFNVRFGLALVFGKIRESVQQSNSNFN